MKGSFNWLTFFIFMVGFIFNSQFFKPIYKWLKGEKIEKFYHYDDLFSPLFDIPLELFWIVISFLFFAELFGCVKGP